MKRVHLNNKYLIDINKNTGDYCLKYDVTKHVKEDGKEYEITKKDWHLGSIDQAIKCYAENLMIDLLKDENCIADVREALKEVKKELEAIKSVLSY